MMRAAIGACRGLFLYRGLCAPVMSHMTLVCRYLR